MMRSDDLRSEPAWNHLVVGGGSAGAALAARLSEDPGRRVLLLEAGPDYAFVDEVPAEMTARAVSDTAIPHDWGFQAEAVPGRVVAYPAGRVTGGSSAINSAVALRGFPADYDEWAAAGNRGWAWEDVLPSFCRLEADADFGGELAHGDAGPLPIRRARREELLSVHRALLDAALALGHAEAPDLNRPDAIGVGPWPMNVRDGIRVSSAAAYLTPQVRRRPNLAIRADSPVRRVVLDGRRATGVELASGERVHAGEVVLAAGAIGTPGLLLRSGIGAPERVREAGGRPVVPRAGVGEGLRDHAFAPLLVVPAEGVCDLPARSVQVGLRYTAAGSPDRGDMQLLIVVPVELGATPELMREVGAERVFMIGAGLQRPHGSGRVRWLADGELGAPRIELDLMGHPFDRARLREGVRLAWRVACSPQMAPFVRRVALLDERRLADDAALDAAIAASVTTFKHPTGTARMGPREDPGAVVDAAGRVHDVDGLRICDMSIAPGIPRANTNLTAIMIGERVAELIRAQPGEPMAPAAVEEAAR